MTQTFEIGQRVTNERDAWVELHAGWGASHEGCQAPIYYATAYAADFGEWEGKPLEFVTLTPSPDRRKVERGMRQWLKSR